jgi:hypothetical protein
VGPNAQSLQGRTSIEEEGQRRTFKTTFNGAKSSVTKNIENKTTTGLVELPNATHDLLSWMLHLRNQQLAPQTTYRFKVWDGWKLVQITARIGVAEKKWVQDKAEIALPARLSRVRISPTGPSSSPKRAKTEDLGTIWFADTPGHRPIAMSFLAPLRNADIQLKQTLTKTCPTDR